MVQSLTKNYKDAQLIAEKYFWIINILNDLGLTKRRIEVLAYAAVNGPIKDRDQVADVFGSSGATINNILCYLQRKKFLIYVRKKGYEINPIFNLDYTELDLTIKVNTNADQAGK